MAERRLVALKISIKLNFSKRICHKVLAAINSKTKFYHKDKIVGTFAVFVSGFDVEIEHLDSDAAVRFEDQG